MLIESLKARQGVRTKFRLGRYLTPEPGVVQCSSNCYKPDNENWD